MLSEISYPEAIDSYGKTAEAENRILGSVETIAKQVTLCKEMMTHVETSLKRKGSLSSIKDEDIKYDTFGDATLFKDGDLRRDVRSGTLTLGIRSVKDVDYQITSVKVNVPRGSRKTPKVGGKTWDFIENGYFHTRSLGLTPLFETEEYTDPGRLSDGRMETNYMVEYNTFSKMDKPGMSVAFELQPSAAVNFAQIIASPADTMDAKTINPMHPHLNAFSILSGSDEISYLNLLTDNRITVKNRVIGQYEKEIQRHRGDAFPTMDYTFPVTTPGTTLRIELVSSKPQQISYPELVILDPEERELKRYNYFETLALLGYEAPEGHFNPRDVYTNREFTDMASVVYSSFNTRTERIGISRYYIGLKEIVLRRVAFESEGTITSRDLNTSRKSIAGVDIYVNEYIPDECAIKYFLSTGDDKWYEIAPSGDTKRAMTIPRRFVYGELIPKTGDKKFNTVPTNLYMRIKMTGSGISTPILKSVAVRIKLI